MLNPCDTAVIIFKARPIASLIMNETAKSILADILLVIVLVLDTATDKLKLGVGILFHAKLLTTLAAMFRLVAIVMTVLVIADQIGVIEEITSILDAVVLTLSKNLAIVAVMFTAVPVTLVREYYYLNNAF